jgi:hypothetical protein
VRNSSLADEAQVRGSVDVPHRQQHYWQQFGASRQHAFRTSPVARGERLSGAAVHPFRSGEQQRLDRMTTLML